MFDWKYWLKRFLHHYWKHRFIPSILVCPVCRHHVQANHGRKQPTHAVFALGGKKPRRVRMYAPFPLEKVEIPEEFDLCEGMPAGEVIEDQKQTGACVAFAWAYVVMWFVAKKLSQWLRLSQEFIYDVGRDMHGAYGQAGMASEWGAEVLGKYGTCRVELDEYENTDFGKMPSQEAYDDAKNYMTEQPGQCFTIEDIEQWMYQKGPMCMGIPVYSSFMSSVNGVIPFPKPNESLEGYHELCLKGVKIINGIRYLKFENSWYLIPGVKPWGDNGYGYYPEELLASDLRKGEADSYYAADNTNPTPGPEPTECDEKFNICIEPVLKKQDVLEIIIGFLSCLYGLLDCIWGQGLLKKRLALALGSKKTRSKTVPFGRSGYDVTVTVKKK